ncbi:hypothetical protein Tco_1406867 [Tanacetum coccineum]
MTKSSNKELIEPYDEPERVLHLLRKLFKTTSFDHSSSSKFELFSDHESGSKNEDANEHIESVLEIVKLFTTPDVTQDKLMLRVFPITLTGSARLDVPTRQIIDSKGAMPKMSKTNAKKAIQEMADHSQKWHDRTSTRNKSSNTSDGLAAIQAQLNNLGRYRTAAPEFYQRNNGNSSYQERRQTVEESLNKFMAESTKRHDEHSSLIKKFELQQMLQSEIKEP